MLEIFGIMLLCNKNKANAVTRGRNPGGFVALTIGLWLGMEILGGILGGLLELGLLTYLLAFALALVGGFISYLVAKNCKPGTSAVSASPADGIGPVQTKFCNQCGTPLLDSAAFCAKCGAPRVAVPVAYGQPTAGASKEKKSPSGFEKFTVIFNLCMGALFLLIPALASIGEEIAGDMAGCMVFGGVMTAFSVWSLVFIQKKNPVWLRILHITLFVILAGLLLLVALFQI